MTNPKFISPLSKLFNDPLVRAAFERAEREQGGAFVVPVNPVDMNGGAAAELEEVAA